MKKNVYLFVIVTFLYTNKLISQNNSNNNYQFQIIKKLPTTSIKNQSNSGTCWSFATISFLESELLRINKIEYDLSEMFIVRKTYPLKAERFLRFQGKNNFGEGGQAHDALNILKKYGIVPETIYSGLTGNSKTHDHSELVKIIEAVLNIAIKQEEISSNVLKSIEAILDVYLGKTPENFEYEGKKYSPTSFAKSLNINFDDYIELTSFSHHPFYSKVILEIPDNWAHDFYYNVPLNDLMEIMEYAIMNGYTFAWDGDISEKSFSSNKGIAIIPAKEINEMTKEEKEQLFKEPTTELNSNDSLRLEMFNNYKTTDDHLMHVVGLAKDKNGTKYYITKNSWGTENSELEGYIYISENYFKLKTIAILLHKNAIPEKIKKKLQL